MGKRIISESDTKQVIEHNPKLSCTEDKKVRELLSRLNPEHIEKREDERRKELEKISKNLTELVFEEIFDVRGVLCEADSVFIHPQLSGLEVIGGHGHSYEGGYMFYMTLNVEPINFDLPVKKISFRGYSPVMIGNKISAKITKYVKEMVGRKSTHVYDNGVDTFYLDRDFKEEEDAIEITILDNENKPLRTDRSTNYKMHFR